MMTVDLAIGEMIANMVHYQNQQAINAQFHSVCLVQENVHVMVKLIFKSTVDLEHHQVLSYQNMIHLLIIWFFQSFYLPSINYEYGYLHSTGNQCDSLF